MIYAIGLILLGFSCDAALADAFAPPRPQRGRYDVCVAGAPLDRSRPGGLHYGPVEHLEALDAFGTAGRYDRSRLARLYGGRRVAVQRGWRQTGDRFESVTLLSPYPDAALTRLDEGTMLIRWTVQGGSKGQ